jgi:hypothetical protein
VATSGRRFRTYVGTMQGRRLPGGPRPIEQIVAVILIVIATMAASVLLPYPTPAVFAVGALAVIGVTMAMGLIKYDGKPTVVAAEEIARQVSANPAAFIVAEETVTPASPAGDLR